MGLHPGEPVADLGLSRGQDLLGVVRVVAREEREPGLFVTGLVVFLLSQRALVRGLLAGAVKQ